MIARRVALFLFAAALLLPRPGAAQTTGGIAGTAKDTTGAILPGVTVEAASPALIEKVRSVVTDASGNYKITDLRPGTYSVTFTLPGFSTFRREGVELSAGFTANVSADMKVGSLEETVTVSGATPIVDVQNARTQNVLKADAMDKLPTGAKNLMAFAAMTLGAMPSSPGRNDVGGDKGEQSTGIILHGGRGDDGRTNWDGMNTNVFFGGGGGQQRTYYFNTVAVQEVVVDTGGSTAETETGGANINMVPKEGGNAFKFYGLANYTGNKFSAKAVPDSIKSRGVGDQSSLKSIYDYGVGVGGPLRKDKAWFYGTHRSWGAQNFGANNYFEKEDGNPNVYTPDTANPAYADTFFADSSFRATVQINGKNKVNHEFHLQHGCSCWLGIGSGALSSPEATSDFGYGPQVLNQTTWNYTATNKLLIQAGASFLRQEVNFVNGSALNASKFTGTSAPIYPAKGIFSTVELNTGYRWNALPGGITSYGPDDNSNNFNQKLTASYITGSHAIKLGLQTLQGNYDFYGMENGVEQVNYEFRAGAPVSLTMFAGPFQSKTRLNSQGIFAQDQWTLKKLTLNVGARYDHFNGRTLAQDIKAGRFRPAFSVDEQKNLPDFKDITYRAAAAYDVFGNGKTAVKASWGKYLMGQGGGLSQQGFAKSVAIATSTQRTWADANGNFTPDCVLENFSANGECGGILNPLFGQPFSVQSLADDVREGWGKREYSTQWNVQLQQELRPGIGLAAGFFHTQWANMSVTRNTRVTASDFTRYALSAPTDDRLGPTSGKSIDGYYDITPAGLAKGAAYQISQASNFGDPKDYFNGVDVGVNAKFGKGILINGGVSVGREVFDFCYVNERPDLTPQGFPNNAFSAARYPRNSDFCKTVPNWWDGIGSQVKAQVVYPLPYDFLLSASFKNLPGIPVTAANVVSTATLAPILGRNSTAAGVATHNVIPGQGLVSATVFDERLNQTDVRLMKNIKIGKGKIQAVLDLYNVMNSRVPQGIVTTYGAAFMRPTALLGGRLWKFGAQFDF